MEWSTSHQPGPRSGPVSYQVVRFKFEPFVGLSGLTETIRIVHTLNLANKYVFVNKYIDSIAMDRSTVYIFETTK